MQGRETYLYCTKSAILKTFLTCERNYPEVVGRGELCVLGFRVVREILAHHDIAWVRKQRAGQLIQTEV